MTRPPVESYRAGKWIPHEKDLRSPLAKARDAWFESEQGRHMTAGTDYYFRNRLEVAFIAGYDAGLKAARARAEAGRDAS